MTDSRVTIPEISRKLIHFFNLVIPISYLTWLPGKMDALAVLGSFTIIALCIDVARIRYPRYTFIFSKFFGSMLRDHERSGKLTGATWVMIGSLASIYLFPKPIAVLALVFMSLGDTFAGLIGKQFGTIKIGQKTVEGSISGLAVCILFVWLFPLVPFHVGIAGAVGGMVVEALPLPFDDNVTIPIASGTIMTLISNCPI